MSGTKLEFTTAYHPQTDGQSEVTNRSLEQYLRSFTFEQPKKLFEFLPWAELAMNCSVNVSIGMSPFKALYGRDPPNIFATPARPTDNAAVAEELGERTELMGKLKKNLAEAQRRMAIYANKHRRSVEFSVGERVWLRLQPYRQVSVGKPISAKLSRRYYGPFTIVERIGKVAYRLQLPLESRIHDVFHVSLLKPFVEPITDSVHRQQLPPNFRHGRPLDTPITASDERMVLIDGVPQYQWLVHWSEDLANPTWEPKLELLRHFPNLSLEDKAALMRGGVDRDAEGVLAPTAPTGPIDELTEGEASKTLEKGGRAKERGRKKMRDAGPRKERPKRNVSQPAKYRDFTPH